MFAGEIPEDSIQVVDCCFVDNSCMVEVQFPSGNMSSTEVEEINSIAVLNRIGRHARNNLIPGLNADLLSERVCAALSGKSVGGDDDNSCMFDDSPDVDEDALIEGKTEYEKTFILKHRSIFSESIKPDKFIRAPPMEISLKNNPNSDSDPSLYRFKPRSVPAQLKSQSKDLVGNLESQGVIRRMKPNEHSKFCAPAGFVPKKSGKLRFVIDFTALNKYVNRPVHSFPSSDDIARSLKYDTTHMACIDFPSGYFQALLSTDSQGYTAFNTEFGRFLFLRAPQGLSSSGDHFNATTDQFFSGLGEWLLKQVDDM